MTIDVQQLINDVLTKEGGFVDHPFDKGGPTNFGTWIQLASATEGLIPKNT